MQELGQGIIRVCAGDGRAVGTGFIVADHLAVTCAHVAVAAVSHADAKPVVFVQFPTSAERYAAELLDCETGADDIAFLHLPTMQGAKPFPLGQAGHPDGHAYETMGYPALTGPAAVQKSKDFINGLVQAADDQRRPLLQLKGNEITHGMSGSPVLDTVTDRVIGMISEHKRQEHANLVYATTSDTIQHYWPSLKLDPPAARAAAPDQDELAKRAASYVQRIRQQGGEPENREPFSGPYPGLDYYRITDAGRFFGRARAIEDVSSRLGPGRLCVLHADSGAGKTSLLLAGIAPRLIQDGQIPVYVRPYTRYPTLAIKQAVVSDYYQDRAVQAASLRVFLQEISARIGQADLTILLDQFEEFFTLQPQQAQLAFAEELAECLEDTGLRVGWVLALRKEQFSDLAVFSPRLNPFGNQYRLPLLTSAEAAQAIVGPANLYGIGFADGLVDQILADLTQVSAPGAPPEAARKDGRLSPPQLQLVCHALIDTLQAGEPPPEPKGARQAFRQITGADYQALGGAAGILRNHLKRVLQNNLSAGQRGAAQRMLEALVSSKGQRLVRTPAQLADELAPPGLPPDELQAILTALVKERILRPLDGEDLLGVPDAAREGTAYELVHDYLAEQITLSPDAYRRKNAQELLERELVSWQSYGALLRPETLAVISDQRAQLHYPGEAGPLLVRSALETGIDLPDWLACFGPASALPVLREGLSSPRADLRGLALMHIEPYLDEETVGDIARMAAREDQPELYPRCLELLHRHDPARLRAMLLADLAGPSPAWRQAQSASWLQHSLDDEVAGVLFHAATTQAHADVWQAALRVLASPEAAPYRAEWRPLRTAAPRRLMEAFETLRALGVQPPFWMVAQSLRARAALLWHNRATRKTILRAAALAGLAALYLLAAMLANLPPYQRLLQVPRAPVESLRALAGPVTLDDQQGQAYYVSTFHYGVAVYDGKAWSKLITTGLPTTELPGEPDRPDSIIQAIDAIAIDPAHPRQAFALTRETGVFVSQDLGQTWQTLFADQQDQPGMAEVFQVDAKELAANSNLLLLAAARRGLYMHLYGTPSWEKVSGRDGLPDGDFRLVRFRPQGSPIAAGPDGLYQASADAPPWTWTKVEGVGPVSRLAFGQDDRLFLALGSPSVETACLVDGRIVEQSRRKISLPVNVVTALASNPTPDHKDTYYIGTQLGQVLECTCQGQCRSISWFLPGDSITGLIYWQAFLNDNLILLNSEGLYQLNVAE